MKHLLACFLIAASAFAGHSLPLISNASAQSLTIDRDGVRIDRDRRSHRVSRSEARRIAERNGMRRIWDIDLRGRYWVVTGDTRRRRDLLRLTIDARTGRVVGRRYVHR